MKAQTILKSQCLLALATSVACAPLALRADIIVVEAETGVLTGTDIETSLPGFTGTGYVGGFDADTDKVTLTVDSPEAALYDVTIRYSSPTGDKSTYLSLNGGGRDEIRLTTTAEEFKDFKATTLYLNQGSNTIDIISNWGYYAIDSLTFTPAASRPPPNIDASLRNPNADAGAVALYNYLKSNYGQHTLSGQQEIQWVDYVTEQTGKTPAIAGLDLMDYSPSRVEHGATSTAIEEAIAFSEKGGIVTFVWHWNAPSGLLDTPEHPWYSGFYTEATTFNVAEALADINGDDYKLLLRDIDAIAVQLLRLQDAGVPVLFRPLHEAEGAWFWWGAQGAEPCKALYALVFDRLTTHHSLNNLVWVWNSVGADWYPGDDTVDIVSTDVYAGGGHGAMAPQFSQLVDLGQNKKLVAVAEVGSVPNDKLMNQYQANWVWFCAWGDGLINNPDQNDPETLKSIYNSDWVLTLDEIQGWRG